MDQTMHDTVAVFDASAVFWRFVYNLLYYPNFNVMYDDYPVCYDKHLVDLSYALKRGDKIGLSKETVWIHEEDIDIMDYPIQKDLAYDANTSFYIFDDLSVLFRTLGGIYSQILGTSYVNDTRLNCVMSYQRRYQMIGTAIQHIEFKIKEKQSQEKPNQIDETAKMFKLCTLT